MVVMPYYVVMGEVNSSATLVFALVRLFIMPKNFARIPAEVGVRRRGVLQRTCT